MRKQRGSERPPDPPNFRNIGLLGSRLKANLRGPRDSDLASQAMKLICSQSEATTGFTGGRRSPVELIRSLG